jgi:hypothetical protein
MDLRGTLFGSVGREDGYFKIIDFILIKNHMKTTFAASMIIAILGFYRFCWCFDQQIGIHFVGQNTNKNRNVISTTITSQQSDTPLPFAGYWISENYVREIQKKKSPRLAEVPLISCFQIPSKTNQITRLISGFHEGGGDLVVLKKGASYELWDNELNKKTNQITIVSSNRIKLDNDFFVKLKNFNVADTTNEPKILEEILFAGKYKTDQGKIVEFKSNGQLIGFENYKSFEAFIDFADQDIQIDKFTVRKNENDGKEFGFQFKGNNLLIYNLKCLEYDPNDKSCIKPALDNLKLRLTKID